MAWALLLTQPLEERSAAGRQAQEQEPSRILLRLQPEEKLSYQSETSRRCCFERYACTVRSDLQYQFAEWWPQPKHLRVAGQLVAWGCVWEVVVFVDLRHQHREVQTPFGLAPFPSKLQVVPVWPPGASFFHLVPSFPCH